MTLAVGAGLAFFSTKTGKRFDGLMLDTMAPLLGSPRNAQKAMVILIGESDYETAQTPLAVRATMITPSVVVVVVNRIC